MIVKYFKGESSNIVSIGQWAWTINIWHTIKQILTYDVGQYGFYGSLTSVNIVASDP